VVARRRLAEHRADLAVRLLALVLRRQGLVDRRERLHALHALAPAVDLVGDAPALPRELLELLARGRRPALGLLPLVGLGLGLGRGVGPELLPGRLLAAAREERGDEHGETGRGDEGQGDALHGRLLPRGEILTARGGTPRARWMFRTPARRGPS